MNKINPFFSDLSQQIHKMYEKVVIITQIWHRAKYKLNKHDQRLVPDTCTKYVQNHHIHLRDITTSTQNLGKNNHNY